MMMKRIYYYDALKCLAIFIVCFAHANVLETNILDNPSGLTYFHYWLESFYSVSIPLFFMVNGALLLNTEFDTYRNIKKILKILFLVYAWAIILLLILKYICHDTYTIKSFFASVWYLKMTRANHLWFLKAIISIYLLLPLIKIAYDRNKKDVLIFTVSIIFILSFGNTFINNSAMVIQYLADVQYLKNDNFNFFKELNPFGYFCFAIFYFIIGGILAKKISNKEFTVNKTILISVCILSQTFTFMYGCLMTYKFNTHYEVVWNGFDTVMTLSLSTSIFILFSQFEYNRQVNRIVSFIGNNTLGIYILHMIYIGMFKHLFKETPLSNNLLANFLFTITIILLSLLTTFLIKRTKIISSLLRI